MLKFAKRSDVQISGVKFPEVWRRVGQREGHLLTIWVTKKNLHEYIRGIRDKYQVCETTAESRLGLIIGLTIYLI